MTTVIEKMYVPGNSATGDFWEGHYEYGEKFRVTHKRSHGRPKNVGKVQKIRKVKES